MRVVPSRLGLPGDGLGIGSGWVARAVACSVVWYVVLCVVCGARWVVCGVMCYVECVWWECEVWCVERSVVQSADWSHHAICEQEFASQP